MITSPVPYSFTNSHTPRSFADKHVDDIDEYLSGFPWRWIAVLTVADIPNRGVPQFSARKLIGELYPRFIERLSEILKVPVDDFWIVEHGKINGRHHLNVLLAAHTTCDIGVIHDTWFEITGSNAWARAFDSSEGVSYWIKHFRAEDTGKLEYGGSAILTTTDKSVQQRPRRKRKKDYHQPPAIRYRAFDAKFG